MTMQRKARVSVIVTVYERAALAMEAATSAMRQTVHDVELIVIDDGSSGDMRTLQHHVADLGGIYVTQEHQGIARSRNKAAALATGEWLAFLDSDDLFYPNKLEQQLLAIDYEGRPWSCSGFDLIDADGATLAVQNLDNVEGEFWLTQCPVGATSIVVDRHLFFDVGAFDTAFEVCEDWDLVVRLGTNFKPAIVAKALYAYRLGCGNITASIDDMWYRSWSQLCYKHNIGPSLLSYGSVAASPYIVTKLRAFLDSHAP